MPRRILYSWKAFLVAVMNSNYPMTDDIPILSVHRVDRNLFKRTLSAFDQRNLENLFGENFVPQNLATLPIDL